MNADIGLFILRVVAGLTFMYHGWPKFKNFKGTLDWLMKERFPLPFISTIGVCLGELFGGVFLVLGIGTLWVALLLAFIMAVAFFYDLKITKAYKGKPELPALLFVICLVLIIAGPGAWALA